VLAALAKSLRQELAQTRAELERARERIAELEARLKQDSRNSSRPPFLSKERTAVALAELFGIPRSSGTVAALTARAAGQLGGFLEHARGQIAASGVAGFDETRVPGGRPPGLGAPAPAPAFTSATKPATSSATSWPRPPGAAAPAG
jgi:Family of unknown function (DUF6444)/Transposase IS66 family